MIVYFLTDVMKWLRIKVEPINETCHSCLIFNWPRFLCTILLCQKSFLKVSSKCLLKNKSDNGKLLLGKTYSGERFRAILALLFSLTFSNNGRVRLWISLY